MGWLDDHRKTQLCLFTPSHIKGWRGQTRTFPQLLGTYLVHADSRRHHAGACVGNLKVLQYALNHAVFATAAMQGNKGGIKPSQGIDALIRRVHQLCEQTQVTQACMYRSTALQRHRAFCRSTTSQHCHAAYSAQSFFQCTLIHGRLPEQPTAWRWHRHYPRLG